MPSVAGAWRISLPGWRLFFSTNARSHWLIGSDWLRVIGLVLLVSSYVDRLCQPLKKKKKHVAPGYPQRALRALSFHEKFRKFIFFSKKILGLREHAVGVVCVSSPARKHDDLRTTLLVFCCWYWYQINISYWYSGVVADSTY